MNELLFESLVMAGARGAKEVSIFPGWAKAENMERSDRYIEYFYRGDGEAKTKKRILRVLRKRISQAFQGKKLQMDS